jgi:hypothetical protein
MAAMVTDLLWLLGAGFGCSSSFLARSVRVRCCLLVVVVLSNQARAVLLLSSVRADLVCFRLAAVCVDDVPKT